MINSKVVVCCLLLMLVSQSVAFAEPDWLYQFAPNENYNERVLFVQPQSNTYGFSSDSSSNGSSGLDIGSLHKYLGWGTLLLAGVTAVSGSDSSLHHNSALAATAFGLSGSYAIGWRYWYIDVERV